MNKIDLILKLVRDNKITDAEAKILMTTEKEYVPYYPISYPNWYQAPITYYGTGYTSSGDTTIFTTTSN